MLEDEMTALAIYAGAALLVMALYLRNTMRMARWARRRSQLR
jgi:hypothetical protein